jgi:hypothetical protein
VLAWDCSGTLLVTSDIECRSFHVYRLFANGSTPPQFIYSLWRGMTTAVVQDVAFSPDGRWIAASSARGTTHVFAIYPIGGPVSTFTHVPPTTPNRVPHTSGFAASLAGTPQHAELPVAVRIKCPLAASPAKQAKDDSALSTSSSSSFSSGTAPLRAHTSQIVAFLPPYPGDQRPRILVFAASGLLTLHTLSAHAPRSPASDADRTQLEVTLERPAQWDVCRRVTWPEYFAPALTQPLPDPQPQPMTARPLQDPSWLSSIEISTHSPFIRPLWASPQITFGTLQRSAQTQTDEKTAFAPVEVHRDGVVMMTTSASAAAASTGTGTAAATMRETVGEGFDSV